MTLHHLPIRPGRFEIVLAAAKRRPKPERYDLRTWAHGYAIYDRGDVIATFHGPQFDLASKVLKRLRDEDERPDIPPPQAA